MSPAVKRQAVQKYTSLGIANSPLNAEFVKRYKRYQKDRPGYFKDPLWPIKLADECDQHLQSTLK